MIAQTSYTPTELALVLGVKPSTIYAWLSRGELRGNKVGARRFITQQQVKEFYEYRRTGEYTDYTYAPKWSLLLCSNKTLQGLEYPVARVDMVFLFRQLPLEIVLRSLRQERILTGKLKI